MRFEIGQLGFGDRRHSFQEYVLVVFALLIDQVEQPNYFQFTGTAGGTIDVQLEMPLLRLFQRFDQHEQGISLAVGHHIIHSMKPLMDRRFGFILIGLTYQIPQKLGL